MSWVLCAYLSSLPCFAIDIVHLICLPVKTVSSLGVGVMTYLCDSGLKHSGIWETHIECVRGIRYVRSKIYPLVLEGNFSLFLLEWLFLTSYGSNVPLRHNPQVELQVDHGMNWF